MPSPERVSEIAFKKAEQSAIRRETITPVQINEHLNQVIQAKEK